MGDAPLAVDCGVVFVCTANVCRSPVAELLFLHRAVSAGWPSLSISSAGVRGLAGQALDIQMATRLRRDGVASENFKARHLMPDQVESAKLILTAEVEHRSAVVQLAPRALTRTFTMLEFVRLVELSGGLESGGTPESRLASAQAAAAAERPYRRMPLRDLSIADPYGGSRSGYDRAYEQLRDFITALVAIALPSTCP